MPRELVPPDEFDTSDQYTTLKWRFTEHWSGEIAEFEVCGLRAYVRDCDGDFTFWKIGKGKHGDVLREGEGRGSNHFFDGLRSAEAALREIIASRIAQLRQPAESAGQTQESRHG